MLIFVELGWLMNWATVSGKSTTIMMEGLLGKHDIDTTQMTITSSSTTSSSTTSSSTTSSSLYPHALPGFQSMFWIGGNQQFHIRSVTHLFDRDMHYTTTVTIKNIGTLAVNNLYCKYHY